MVQYLPATRKRHGLHSSGATRTSTDPLCKMSLYTNLATDPAHKSIYCSKSFSRLSEPIKEIKAALPEEELKFRISALDL